MACMEVCPASLYNFLRGILLVGIIVHAQSKFDLRSSPRWDDGMNTLRPTSRLKLFLPADFTCVWCILSKSVSSDWI